MGGKKEEIIAAIAEKNELHWTEEDRGKWGSCSSKKNHSKVSEVLSTMKAMACQGNSEVINSLKSTISHCQKVEEESKAELLRVKEEKKKQAEEVKLQKDLENRAIQRKTKNEENGKSSAQDVPSVVKTGSLTKTKQDKPNQEARKIFDPEAKIREGEKDTNRPAVSSSNSLNAEEIERLAEEEEERAILELERKIEQRRKEEELQADFFKRQKEEEKKKTEEESRKRTEEEKKKIAEEEKKKKAEEEKKRKKVEEERQKRAEEKKKRAEE